MNASLPIADSPPYEEPTPVTVPAASLCPSLSRACPSIRAAGTRG